MWYNSSIKFGREGKFMGVQFILGKVSADHEKASLDQLKQWQSENPNGNFFYLVPEHIKFESEVSVLKKLQDEQQTNFFATTNVQVLSFTRLAWYFLRDSTVLNRQSLSETGLTMIIAHLLNKLNAQELVIFSNEQNQPGFAQKLAKQLLELRLSNFEPEDLEKLKEAASKRHQANLADKLSDLATIYREFLNYKIDEQNILDVYLDSAKLLELLEETLNKCDLSNVYFIINGFQEFNARELKIISALMQNAHDVSISLYLDDEASKKMPRTNEIFYQTAKLYRQLITAAKPQKVQLRWATDNRVNSSLQKFEQYWIDSHKISAIMNDHELTPEEKNDIKVTQTIDRISELKWVAGQIRRLIAESEQTDHPYQYSDFLILTPDTDKYQNMLEPIFDQFKIPVFTDLTQTMVSHPLVEFILAVFDIQKYGFNYQSMMRFLKTELFVPLQIITGKTLERMKQKQSDIQIDKDATEIKMRQTATFRNTLDVVENYILANGIQTKKQWEEEWIVSKLPLKPNESQAQLLQRERELVINRNANELRRQVLDLFDSFDHEFKQVKSGRDFAIVLFNFMEKAHVAECLQRWQQAAVNIQQEYAQEKEVTLHGSATDPTRSQQVWDVFCQLLDEYVLALGDEPFDREMFVNIFQSGFESAKYKRVPSTLDQVIFSKTSVLQMLNRKITFIIGATDDVMPMKLDSSKLLSEDDRDMINSVADKVKISDDKYLPETCELKMAAEPFTNYLAFLSASEKLYFVYPINDTDGTDLKISPYVSSICDALNLPVTKLGIIAPNYGPEIINYVGNYVTTASELLNICRELKRNHEELSPQWQAIYQYLTEKDPERIAQVFSSLSYQNEVLPQQEVSEDGHKQLDKVLVDQLYGQEIFGSISRLETYYKNPYEYFLKYGLKLKPRSLYEPTSANVGDYFHEVMAGIIDELQQNGQTLSEMSSAEFDQILSKVLQTTDLLPEFKVFAQNARNRYLQGRLKKSTRKVSRAIYRQHHHRKVFSLKSEATFGFGNDAVLHGKRFYAIDVGETIHPQMKLQGRLDRIDLVEDENKQLYYNVADYKSGPISAKLDKFLIKSLSGISLQLLTYLAVLRDNQHQLLTLLDSNQALKKQLDDSNKKLSLGSAVYFHLGTPAYKQIDYQKVNTVNKSNEFSDRKFIYDGIFRGGEEGLDYIKALGSIYQNSQKEIDLNNYNLGLLKSGKLDKRSQKKVYDIKQFNDLLNMDLYKISQATNDIFAGVIDLAPYKLNNLSGLDYSDYLPIMTFDTLIGNQYRDLNDLTHYSKEQIWDEIYEESKLWNQIKAKVDPENNDDKSEGAK